MPEITDSEMRQFLTYQNLGTPNEIQKKISDLETDNHAQREELRETRTKLPADGEVVVPKEDADLLPKFKELGDPDTVKSRLDEGETAKTRLVEVETKTAAAQFAKAAGLAEEAVDTLVELPALKGAKFEVRKSKQQENGKEVEAEVGYLTLPGDDQKAMSFTDAQGKIPALKGLRTATPDKGADRTVSFHQQGPDNKGKTGTVYDQIREARASEKTAAEKGPQTKPINERLGMRPVGS